MNLRRARCFLAAISLGLACSSQTAALVRAAVAIEGPESDHMLARLQQWVREDGMPTGRGVIQIVPENCAQLEAAACTYWTHVPRFVMYFPDLDYLWTHSGYTDAERVAAKLNFYHELGHVLDFGLRRHAYRIKWFALMNYERPLLRPQSVELEKTRNPRPWFHAYDSAGKLVNPAEQFAQAYNYCAENMSYPAMRATMRSVYWGFSYHPNRREYHAACALIRSL